VVNWHVKTGIFTRNIVKCELLLKHSIVYSVNFVHARVVCMCVCVCGGQCVLGVSVCSGGVCVAGVSTAF